MTDIPTELVTTGLTSQTVGTCSICGGRVSVPFLTSSTPSVPTCNNCGAIEKQGKYGPIIPMVRSGAKP